MTLDTAVERRSAQQARWQTPAVFCGVLVLSAVSPGVLFSAEAAAGLAGTVLVSRPTGVALVQPLTGNASVLPIGGASSRPLGVAWSAERKQIAVSMQRRQVGERSAGADLLVLDPAGAEVSSIPRDQPEVALLSPTWLSSSEVAYERGDVSGAAEPSRIQASQPDGSARRTLVFNARLPGPSPDGMRLAYVAPGPSSDRLLLVDLPTGETRALVDNVYEGFAYFSRPRFSPDGSLVAFGASGGPNLGQTLEKLGFTVGLLRNRWFAAPRRHGPSWDVWIVGADGSALRQVTQFEYEDDLAVAWSPDGDWLIASGPNALYLVPMGVRGPATPIGRGGLGEPDWAATELVP